MEVIEICGIDGRKAVQNCAQVCVCAVVYIPCTTYYVLCVVVAVTFTFNQYAMRTRLLNWFGKRCVSVAAAAQGQRGVAWWVSTVLLGDTRGVMTDCMPHNMSGRWALLDRAAVTISDK